MFGKWFGKKEKEPVSSMVDSYARIFDDTFNIEKERLRTLSVGEKAAHDLVRIYTGLYRYEITSLLNYIIISKKKILKGDEPWLLSYMIIRIDKELLTASTGVGFMSGRKPPHFDITFGFRKGNDTPVSFYAVPVNCDEETTLKFRVLMAEHHDPEVRFKYFLEHLARVLARHIAAMEVNNG